jgi:hypothetical protein
MAMYLTKFSHTPQTGPGCWPIRRTARGAGLGHRERGREAARFLVRIWGGRQVRADRTVGRRRGRLRVDSVPGQGTRTTGTVPVTGSQPGPAWWPVMVREENTTVLLPVVTSRNAWWWSGLRPIR